MKQVIVYGIKNCDTMKKTFQWLEHRKIDYIFHDYRKDGVDAAVLQRALHQYGWKNVLNRKGTTWRALPEQVKTLMNDSCAIETAEKNPSVLRRPLLLHGKDIHLGFDKDAYEEIFPEKKFP